MLKVHKVQNYYNTNTIKASYTVYWIILKHKKSINRLKGMCM